MQFAKAIVTTLAFLTLGLAISISIGLPVIFDWAIVGISAFAGWKIHIVD